MGGLEKLVSLSAKTGINAYVLTPQIKSQLRGACYAFMVVLKRGTEAVVRTNYPRAFMILAAVVLATILLLLIVATKPAEAAFPGRNGKKRL